MKKVLFSTVCIFMIIASVRATDGADWQEYAGRYVLSLDNSEETVDIAIRGDSTLTAFSSLGEVTLTHAGADRFEFRRYGGVVVFERDDKQHVIACRISVAVIDVEEVKARKQ
ncbi:MAG: hypothetical protein LBJ58_06830 [Tannerellaceae bacterium]|jgi:hypothetical protein|nr:hypothetical protein [Tannerellaceae bacterium]